MLHSVPRAMALLLAVAALVFPTPARGQLSTIHEEFEGGFSQRWSSAPGSLPDEWLYPFRPNVVGYGGGQNLSFSGVDGAGVLLMSRPNAPRWTRFGFVTRAALTGTIGVVEARIQTLVQGGATTDGLFDLWLVNSRNVTRFVRVGLFGDWFDTVRCWNYSSTLEPYSTDGPEVLPLLPYQNHTWYRVRIAQLPGESLQVSIWSDAGDRKLASHRFRHALADLGDSFQIGLSQWMGGPHLTHSLLCAVDRVSGWLAY